MKKPNFLYPPFEDLDRRCERHVPVTPNPILLAATRSRVALAYPRGVEVVAAADGARIWQMELAEDVPSAIWLVDDDVLLASTTGLTRFDAEGTPKWRLEATEEAAFHGTELNRPGGVITTLTESTIRTYDLATGALRNEIDTTEDYRPSARDSYTTAFAAGDAIAAPLGRQLTVWRDGGLDEVVHRSGLPTYYYGAPGWIVSPDQTRAAELTLVESGTMVFETERFSQVAQSEVFGEGGLFLDAERLLLWSPNSVTTWNITTGEAVVRRAAWHGHRCPTVVDETFAVSVSAMGELCFWNPASFSAAEEAWKDDPSIGSVVLDDSVHDPMIVVGREPARLVTLNIASGRIENPRDLPESIEEIIRVDAEHYAMFDSIWDEPTTIYVSNNDGDTVARRGVERPLTFGRDFVVLEEDGKIKQLRYPDLAVEREWTPPEGIVVDEGIPGYPHLVQTVVDDENVVYDLTEECVAIPEHGTVHGALMVADGWDDVTYDHIYRIWSLQTREQLGELNGSDLSDVLPCGRENCVFIRNYDGLLTVWRPGTGFETMTPPEETWLSELKVSRDGRWLIGVGERIMIWDTSAPQHPLYDFETFASPVDKVEAEGNRLFVSDAYGLFGIFEI